MQELVRENVVAQNNVMRIERQTEPVLNLNNNQIVLKSFSALANKSKKKDVINLLSIEGRFYLPPERNLNSSFLKQFFAGNKRLYKVSDVQMVGQSFRFKELAITVLLQNHPRAAEARMYLPDEANLSKLDRTYTLNVG